MCTSYSLRTCLALLLLVLLATSSYGQQVFGPVPYVSLADRPDGFCEDCQVEDFEDNEVNPFLSLDCGEILGPNISDPLIPDLQITDSVDADDGEIDGSGNGGHSYFCVDPARGVTVTFTEPVVAAGAVWTDGDREVSIQIEAFDSEGNSLATSELAQVADNRFFGETAEDRFLGVQAQQGIAAIRISTAGNGAGIEIDHVTWDAQELGETPLGIDDICQAVASENQDSAFDSNGDGVVDFADVDFALAQSRSILGDLNGSGSVDFNDFLGLSENFGSNEGTYSTGDLDCNGSVGFLDFLRLSRNFGTSFSEDGGEQAAGVAAVPEPSAHLLCWVCLGLLGLARRRRA